MTWAPTYDVEHESGMATTRPYLPGERWCPIPGHEANYQVSTLGRVYSRPRERTRGGILKTPRSKQHGYPEVHLYADDGGRRAWRVHILVSGQGPTNARHLVYGTRSENVLDRVRLGTHNMARKTICIRGHDLNDPDNVYSGAPGHRACRARRRWCWRQRKAAA